MRPGVFVSIEGTDGSGKSTQAEILAEKLRAGGHDVVLTREPGGTEIGERVRDLLYDRELNSTTTMTTAMLYAAARAQLVQTVVRPALSRGQIVIADRYADSTLAYQVHGQQLPLSQARQLIDLATAGLWPDLTVFVDVPPEVAVTRLSRRANGNLVDAEAIDFHQRVYAGYLLLVQAEPERWRRVDGTAPVDVVSRAVFDAVRPALAAEARPA